MNLRKMSPQAIEAYFDECRRRGVRINDRQVSMPRGVPIPVPPVPNPKKKKRRKDLVEPMVAVIRETLVIVAPVVCESITNGRDHWTSDSGSVKSTRDAISKLFLDKKDKLHPYCVHYKNGGILNVKFTRLGGAKLDKLANLGASFKAVEDALCLVMGTDDGDDRWNAIGDQDTKSERIGVRIEITKHTEGQR